jgi:hypothetical protein
LRLVKDVSPHTPGSPSGGERAGTRPFSLLSVVSIAAAGPQDLEPARGGIRLLFIIASATLATDIPISAGQQLWLAAPAGSRFGMYPAIEINLPSTTFALLNHRVMRRLGTRFAASTGAPTCSLA